MKNKRKILTLLSVTFLFIFCFCLKNVESANDQPKVIVNSVSLLQNEVEPNGKIYLDLKITGDKSNIKKMNIAFSSTVESFEDAGREYEIKDINTDKPYFELNNSVKENIKMDIFSVSKEEKNGNVEKIYSNKVKNYGEVKVFTTNDKDFFIVKSPINLNDFLIKDLKTSYNFNDKVYFNINQTGSELSYVSVNIRNIDNGKTIIVYLKDVTTNPYLELSTLKLNSFSSGNYIIKDVNLFYKNKTRNGATI